MKIVLTISETHVRAGYSLYEKIIADILNFCNHFLEEQKTLHNKATTRVIKHKGAPNSHHLVSNVQLDISKKREGHFYHFHR